MTSIHAIEWLDTIINVPQVCGGNLEDNNKALNRVKKDLEVLEILKSKIGLNYIPIQIDIKQEKYILTGAKITKEEYELLKEWLDNGKSN